MADETKPEGEVPPEAEKPQPESPAPPVTETSGSEAEKPAEEAPASEAPAAAAEQPPAPEKPAGEQAPAAAEKPAAPVAKPAEGAAKPPAAAPKAKPAAKPPPKKAPTVMEVEPWEGPLVDGLKARFDGLIKEFSTYRGQDFLVAELASITAILEYLKVEEDFDYLVDITAVDYPKKDKRFELVWILYSFDKNTRVRVKAEAGEGETPATATGVHHTADWLEREVYDMFGIRFDGHPNMIRILMPDEWEGYPLRKDYSIIEQDQNWVRENLQIESAQ
jgi:NADH-quinone oxidoreductase subunit C